MLAINLQHTKVRCGPSASMCRMEISSSKCGVTRNWYCILTTEYMLMLLIMLQYSSAKRLWQKTVANLAIVHRFAKVSNIANTSIH